jgi:hypothetical protein
MRYLKQSTQMQLKSQANGYLTVYLSLSMTVILSLILALLSGARIGAVKMKTELVSDIAMNSVLGEYNRELFDRYGLLFLDDSYGSKSGSIKNVEEHLADYFRKNFELTDKGITGRKTYLSAKLLESGITGYSVASDNGGAVLKRQILSYMEGDAIGKIVKNVSKNVDDLNKTGYDSTDFQKKVNKNNSEISETYSADTDGDGEDEEIDIDNPAQSVASKRRLGILTLAAPDMSKISSAAINSDLYASHRSLSKGTGLDDKFSMGASEKALFNEYIFEKTSCYGAEKDDSRLKYELEYIYAGKDSDYKNLEKVAEKLLLWREASNFAYIMTDKSKLAEAEALALTASAVIAMPELCEIVKTAIILSWTFAESVSDLHILLTGGKVPLVKTAKSWRLSLEAMLSFGDHLKDGGGSGLKYEDYLRMLILTENDSKKTMRLMDVIEMNVRSTKGNDSFKIDNCIDAFRADFKASSRGMKSFEVDRIYSYEMG